ncbi:MAG TPA: DUF1491 family protein [Sphingobium sp.]|uniref:DUF1491 family protein n=1 Tax=Sphingobium sp. TaxID=1912891 RepID=UPI002ED241FF
MTGRLPSKLLVSALVRRVGQSGGFASVLSHGEDMGGVILVQAIERGAFSGLFERMVDFDGVARLVRCGPPAGSDSVTVTEYVDRRLGNDPDMWVVELDIADAERFAAETIAMS